MVRLPAPRPMREAGHYVLYGNCSRLGGFHGQVGDHWCIVYRRDRLDRADLDERRYRPAAAARTDQHADRVDACRGCDVLIHEVLTLEWLAQRPDFQNYAARHHTTTTQLTDLAIQAKPRLLILYHASLS